MNASMASTNPNDRLGDVPPDYYHDVLRPEVLARLTGPSRHMINGEAVDAASGKTFVSINPATGRPLLEVARGSADDVDRAVRGARAAFLAGWRDCPPRAREQLLGRLADLIEAHATELAQLDSLEAGHPAAQIEAGDLVLSAAVVRYYAGWPTKLQAETIPVSSPGFHVYTRREPVGVVGAITPWNFPFCQACFKVAPALAAGCTVVLKPAEQTSLSTLRLAELALEAGIPPGVVNVVTGFGEDAGAALVRHPDVAKISFTGSESVGKQIAQTAAQSLKHVSLELGGKNPNVIFADADLSQAIPSAAGAIFRYGGQVCAAGSRLMIQQDIYEDVLEGVISEAQSLHLGPGLDPSTTLGPLVSAEQLARVRSYVEQAMREGADVAYGGPDAPDGPAPGGHFHLPTVLREVPDRLTVVREEVFGPVLVTQSFTDLEDLAARANDSALGLSAGVWTNDVRKAHRLANLLEAGTVWINTYGRWDPAAPWGGFKQSGYGRDLGPEGIAKHLQTKTIWTNYQ